MSAPPDIGTDGLDLARPGVIWLAGEAVPFERSGESRAVARMVAGHTKREKVVAASFGDLLDGGPDAAHLRVGGRRRKDALAAVDRWYRREARQRITAVTKAEADRLDLHPAKISIRDQRTRWGSCSTSGTLSFNWRLVIGPEHALRYVVVHELIHIRHHNHSRAFWSALTEALPDWKRSALWLRGNERAITGYVPQGI